MKIVIDAFGGDNAPKSVIGGAVLAKGTAELVLTGSKAEIERVAAENSYDISGIQIVDTQSVVTMHDDPKVVLKAKSDSSMAVGLRMVADGEADAFVSAGSTAALLMGGTFIVRRQKGIKRPALASVIPNLNGCFLLIDCGANAEARPEMLVQFAKMGSVYMNRIQKVENPRVGLVNNGVEESKGTEGIKETYRLLSALKDINFVGNVEARELAYNGCDVAVADGFVGNVVLKTMEGLGTAMFVMLKEMFYKNIFTKLAAAIVKPGLRVIKHRMDSSEYGGAPLLGLSKPVIKAHGSSDAKAIKNAVRQAVACAQSNICAEIGAAAGDEEE